MSLFRFTAKPQGLNKETSQDRQDKTRWFIKVSSVLHDIKIKFT